MSENIYVLYNSDPLIGNNIFYVGRTSNPSRRLKEHKYLSKFSHEDKYVKIRELESFGIKWGLKVICQVDDKEAAANDYERFYVIKYIRDGYRLTNMKHGDILKNRVILELVENKEIKRPSDIKVHREKLLKDIAELKSSKLILRVLNQDNSKEVIFKRRVDNLNVLLSTYGYVDLLLATGLKKSKLQGLLDGRAVKGKYDSKWARDIEEKTALPKGWLDSKLSKEQAEDELSLLFKNRYDRIIWLEMVKNSGYVYKDKSLVNFISKNKTNRISFTKASLMALSKKYGAPVEYLNEGMPKLIHKDVKANIPLARLQNLMILIHSVGGLEEFSKVIGVSDNRIAPYLESFPKVSKELSREIVRKIERLFHLEEEIMDYELVKEGV